MEGVLSKRWEGLGRNTAGGEKISSALAAGQSMIRKQKEDSAGAGTAVIKLRLQLPVSTQNTERARTGKTPSPPSKAHTAKKNTDSTERQTAGGREQTARAALSLAGRSPPYPSRRRGAAGEAKGTVSAAGANGAENIPEKNALPPPPIKLTLRLAAPAETGKPKIMLSVRKRPEDRTEKIDVEAVERTESTAKNTLAPRIKRVRIEGGGESASGNSNDNGGEKKIFSVSKAKRPTKEKLPQATLHPYATISAAAKSVTIPSTKIPIPNFRSTNMTRVPIAALSSISTLNMAEREEERQLRQCLGETLGSLWSMVTKPDVTKAFESWEEVSEKTLPFWLMLAPVDSLGKPPSLRPAAPEQDALARSDRLAEDINKLKGRFNDFVLAEKNKEIATELLVLEQRLCLEEEKFLYAKLKSEYNKKVTDLIARKRQLEGASAAGPPSAFNPHQRILPKLGTTCWSTAPGIQALRGGTENPHA